MKYYKAILFVFLAGVLLFFSFSAEKKLPSSSLRSAPSIAKETSSLYKPIFPDMLNMDKFTASAKENQRLYAVPAKEESLRLSETDDSKLPSILLNNDIFALYGKPGAYTMGILGQYSLDKIEEVMNGFVALYDSANGQRGIIPAFYIIYGTCWPGGEIGILSETVTREYIDFAAKRGWLVFLDHQIGRYSVESAVEKLLPWLKYDNVHLALDPEWHTDKPMREIGSVTADELNKAQQMMQDYIIKNNLPNRRMLIVHQFKPMMIRNRDAVRSDFELVKLIHCADGFGAPHVKKSTYASNAQAKNMPLKSFKLFLKPTIEGAGYDNPLMTPEEVLSLNPRPYLIMYQ